ncbi:metal-sensing transcriptional repressor [Anoxybacillus sp. LAT_35]|uniref:Transcriptional regulator n=1 Tax=Anoxybacillus kestanbolensis TaxID=227476 RepID=A0A1V3FSL6_9BACL|nr:MULTISPECIES: metal-sensing transcriptional repressor [Anoxybacillus]MCG5024599.1 metal-sensing transcriptional repressor [Anoxybacillus flavithermus]MCG6196112.1 metal-sensing transcriptional repressor [Anoxybacillus sp. LAT_38]QAV26903.1 transcriptional regulator [Neobacillus thermocopriae]MCG3083335.1 metal-sensing transcriptional repressor [Anoxybacillus sp. LAT27]MCG6172226.1 metal-sensing transcriptional repressor [Anoxybacillus sp. LAT_11]
MNHCEDHNMDKKMVPRTEQEIESIMKRLKRIEGQVRGVQKMVEDNRYCIDILVQISAITAALNKVGLNLLERHVSHCVSKAIREGSGEESIRELMDVIKQFSK